MKKIILTVVVTVLIICTTIIVVINSSKPQTADLTAIDIIKENDDSTTDTSIDGKNDDNETPNSQTNVNITLLSEDKINDNDSNAITNTSDKKPTDNEITTLPNSNIENLLSDDETIRYIYGLTNSDIERIMNWDFTDNKIVLLSWLFEEPYDYFEDYNPNGYFSDDGKSFISVSDDEDESIFKYANVSFTPPLNGTIKATSVFGVDCDSGLLLTSNNDLYLGTITGPEEVTSDFMLTINFNKIETPKKVTGLDKNIVKYADGDFGYVDIQNRTFKISDINIDNMFDEILFRLLHGSYTANSIKDSSGKLYELTDINISNIEYLILGSLSVYGFDNPFYIGLRFAYNDINSQKQIKSAYYNDWFNDFEDNITAIPDHKHNSITITNSNFLKEVKYNFETDNSDIKNIKLDLYLQDGHIIETQYDCSINELRDKYEDYANSKYLDLIEAAAYGDHYYYFPKIENN